MPERPVQEEARAPQPYRLHRDLYEPGTVWQEFYLAFDYLEDRERPPTIMQQPIEWLYTQEGLRYAEPVLSTGAKTFAALFSLPYATLAASPQGREAVYLAREFMRSLAKTRSAYMMDRLQQSSRFVDYVSPHREQDMDVLVGELMAALDPRVPLTRHVLTTRFGLDDGIIRTDEQTAIDLKISVSDVVNHIALAQAVAKRPRFLRRSDQFIVLYPNSIARVTLGVERQYELAFTRNIEPYIKIEDLSLPREYKETLIREYGQHVPVETFLVSEYRGDPQDSPSKGALARALYELGQVERSDEFSG